MPFIDSLPDVGCVKSSSILTIVVFPAPLGPRRAKYSPVLTENETLSTAVREPYRLVAAFNSIMNEVYVLRHGTVNKIWRFMQMIMERLYQGARYFRKFRQTSHHKEVIITKKKRRCFCHLQVSDSRKKYSKC